MNGRSHLAVNFASAVVLSSIAVHVNSIHISGDALSWHQVTHNIFTREGWVQEMNLPTLTSPASLQKVLFYTSMLLGAWLPDLDQPNSYISQRLSWVSAIVRRFFSHRTFTHSFLGVMTSLLFFSFLGWLVKLFLATRGIMIAGTLQQGYLLSLVMIAIGCIGHMVADTLTPAGIPWFWPAPGHWKIPIIHGEFQEFFVVFAYIFLVGVGVGFNVLTF